MSVNFNSIFVSDDIKVRYREPFITEGLNAKTAINTPRGIYRGFLLTAGSTNFTVDVAADSAHNDHVAVYEVGAGDTTSTRYALTLRKKSGNFSLDLTSLNGGSEVTAYIALFASFAVGGETLAEVRAYTAAEWGALSATVSGELLLLGTCVIPASGSPAPVTTFNNLTQMPWQEVARNAQPWSPVLRNPGFEYGAASDPSRYQVADWRNAYDAGDAGYFRVNSTTPRSGARHLEHNRTSTSTTSDASILQYIEVGVVPGQAVRVTGWCRQLIAPTAGTYSATLAWGTETGAASGSSALDFQVIGDVDADYRKFEETFIVPAAKYTLKALSFVVANVTTGSTGVALLIDDVQVFVEPTGPTDLAAAFDKRLQQLRAGAIVLETDDGSADQTSDAAVVYYDKTAPDRVILERRDQDYSGVKVPPALELFGRLILGEKLRSTEALAQLARITTEVSTVAGVDFTLMWSSPRDGETAGSYTEPICRIYAAPEGRWVFTVNALWGTTTWSKDVLAAVSSKLDVGEASVLISFTDASASPWNDASWSDTHTISATGIVLGADASVTVSGAGVYKHPDRVLSLPITGGSSNEGDTEPWLVGGSVTVSSNLVYLTGTTSGQSWIVPVCLHVGDRIKEVRARVQDTAGGSHQISMTLHASTVPGTESSPSWDWFSGSAAVGSTTSAGDGTVQTLALTGLTTIVASLTFYHVIFQNTSTTNTTHRVLGVEITYDRP